MDQAYNAISYTRRVNILNILTAAEKPKVKTTLKDKAKIIEELFGKEFRRHIKDTAKAKKESKEVYSRLNKRRSEENFGGRSSYNNNRRPFPRSPLFAKQDGGRSYGGSSSNKTNIPRRGGYNSQRGNFNNGFKKFGKQGYKITWQQHGFHSFSRISPLSQLKHVHPLIKKLFPKPRNREFWQDR